MHTFACTNAHRFHGGFIATSKPHLDMQVHMKIFLLSNKIINIQVGCDIKPKIMPTSETENEVEKLKSCKYWRKYGENCIYVTITNSILGQKAKVKYILEY